MYRRNQQPCSRTSANCATTDTWYQRIAKTIILVGVVTCLITTIAKADYTSAIVVSNYSFEATPLNDNQFDFGGVYLGWDEFDLSLVPVVGTNVGPINLPAADIPSQATSGVNTLYFGNNSVRVDQTTNHLISNANKSITIGFDVGVDTGGPSYRGYHVSLYAEDGLGVKTEIGNLSSTIDGNDPAAGTFVRQSLSLSQAQLNAFAGQKIGVSLRTDALAGARDTIFDTVSLSLVNEGVNFPVKNAGFDNTTGLVGVVGPNTFDFTNAYVGWTETDLGGAPVVGTNVGPIWVANSDVPGGASSSVLALYAGNNAVRVQQTTGHSISASDASITVGIDVAADLVVADFAGYVISVYADDGLGTKTPLKTISSSVDGNNPAYGDFLRKAITLTPAEYGSFLGQKIGVSLGKENSTGRDPIFDSVTLSGTTQGAQIAVINSGFDDHTGLFDQGGDPGLGDVNDYDFTNVYTGWKEYDALGNEVAGTNVGPINVSGGDIAGGATTGTLALYQGNAGVTTQQTTDHFISVNDTSFRLAVDVGNDVIGGFGGYLISLFAEDGLGNKTLLKSMSSSGDEFAPNDDAFLTLALDLAPADFSAFIGQKIGISLGGEGGPRDLFYDSVSLTFTAIPEPTSGLLFTFATLGLLVSARRRASRSSIEVGRS